MPDPVFVCGWNWPGYLPEAEPRGPYSWRDAVSDLKQQIEEDHESAAAIQVEEYGDSADADRQRDEAFAELDAAQPGDIDVRFISRAYFIRTAEDEDGE